MVILMKRCSFLITSLEKSGHSLSQVLEISSSLLALIRALESGDRLSSKPSLLRKESIDKKRLCSRRPKQSIRRSTRHKDKSTK